MERKNMTTKDISELREELSWHMKSLTLELEKDSVERFREIKQK